MTRPAYMAEPWFELLAAEIARTSVTAVAARLDVSHAAVSMVHRGGGAYGTGAASTRRFAERVQQMLGQLACPFLAQTTGDETYISGDQCRAYAYREAPTASPLQTRHWQACRSCALRVSAPRGWDEATRKFIDLDALRTQLKRASKGSHHPVAVSSPGVAAPVHQPIAPKEAA